MNFNQVGISIVLQVTSINTSVEPDESLSCNYITLSGISAKKLNSSLAL